MLEKIDGMCKLDVELFKPLRFRVQIAKIANFKRNLEIARIARMHAKWNQALNFNSYITRITFILNWCPSKWQSVLELSGIIKAENNLKELPLIFRKLSNENKVHYNSILRELQRLPTYQASVTRVHYRVGEREQSVTWHNSLATLLCYWSIQLTYRRYSGLSW